MDDYQFLMTSFRNEQALPPVVLVEDDTTLGKTVKLFLEKKLQQEVQYYTSVAECLVCY